MKKKIALLLTAAMLFGVNQTAYAEEKAAEIPATEQTEAAGTSKEVQEAEATEATGAPTEEMGVEATEATETPVEVPGAEVTETEGTLTEEAADAQVSETEEKKPEEDEKEEAPAAKEESTETEVEAAAAVETTTETEIIEEKVEMQTASENQVNAGLVRFIEPKNSVFVVRGESIRISTSSYKTYDESIYEYINDKDHVLTSLLYFGEGSITLIGNTSSETKIIASKAVEYGFFDGFDVQIGEDETAEELTISVKLGGWAYSLKNKETGEIIRVRGDDDGRTVSTTLRIVDKEEQCTFQRKLTAKKTSVRPGEETVIHMAYSIMFDVDKYKTYSDEKHLWFLGIKSCTVSGNKSENTRIENRHDYGNTRYLVVGEDETAEEITIIMECEGWRYWLQDKATGAMLRISSDEKETLQLTVKIGKETVSDSIEDDNKNEFIIIDEPEAETGNGNDENTEENAQSVTYANTVTGVNGAKIVSTVDGIYQVTNIAGAAVVTPKEQVETAVGIASGEGKVKFYVCNNRNKKAGTALEEAAALNGKQALTTFNLDLYVISKEGQVDRICDIGSKVRVVIGIPARFQNADKPYTIGIIGTDGVFYVLEDMDDDPNTITIETDKFGIMALMN